MKKNIFLFQLILFLNTHFLFSQTWQKFDSLRSVYQDKQQYDSALVFAEKALQLAKENVGENETVFANMLKGMFEVNYYLGNYSKAFDFCEKEPAI